MDPKIILMMINFHEVKSDSDLLLIENMANTIWHEHYTPIIGHEQVVYMLDKFQSVNTMKAQIDTGYHYFTINHDDIPMGYLSFNKRNEELFLSKIYVLKESRGKGIGKKAMNFVLDMARGLDCSKVSLTVNKYNHNSIKAYESIGFRNIQELVQDIGGGFVMDDYLMEKSI